MNFIIAQVLGITNFGTMLILSQQKRKSGILLLNMLENFIGALIYSLLGAFSGVYALIICLARDSVIFFYEKNKKRKPIWIFISIVFALIIVGFCTWKNIFSILPLFGTLMFSWGLWQKNTKITRITLLIVTVSYGLYSLSATAYTDAIRSSIKAIAVIIGIFRLSRAEEKI